MVVYYGGPYLVVLEFIHRTSHVAESFSKTKLLASCIIERVLQIWYVHSQQARIRALVSKLNQIMAAIVC